MCEMFEEKTKQNLKVDKLIDLCLAWIHMYNTTDEEKKGLTMIHSFCDLFRWIEKKNYKSFCRVKISCEDN